MKVLVLACLLLFAPAFLWGACKDIQQSLSTVDESIKANTLVVTGSDNSFAAKRERVQAQETLKNLFNLRNELSKQLSGCKDGPIQPAATSTKSQPLVPRKNVSKSKPKSTTPLTPIKNWKPKQ